jgi:hypothetical protein
LLKAVLFLATTMTAAASHAAAAGVPPVSGGGDIQVEFRDGFLTLEAREASLDDVLRAIGEEAGFKVVIKGDLSALVSQSFSGLPLNRGLRQLAGRLSFVMSYGASGRLQHLTLLRDATAGEGAAPAPEVLIVYEPSQAEMEAWILKRLAHEDRQLRVIGVRRLKRLEPDVAVEIAAEVLKDDPDPIVRGQAAATLGKVGGDSAASLLDEVLADEDASVRNHAVRALAALDGDLAAQSLGQVLLDHPDRDLRHSALEALSGNTSATARET